MKDALNSWKIFENLHERHLRLINSDKKSSYEELLGKDGLVSIHHRNVQALAAEVYNVKSGYIPKIFSDLFNQRQISPYNLRRRPEFRVPLTRTVYDVSESILYLGSIIWDILPASFNWNGFKKLIKKWVPQACLCRLYKNYIPGVGFEPTIKSVLFLIYWFSNMFTPMAQLVFDVFFFVANWFLVCCLYTRTFRN